MKNIDKIKIAKEVHQNLNISLVINHLNECTGKRFRPESKGNKELISKQLNAGFSVSDLKLIIDLKTHQWLHIPKMVRALNPGTLFGEHNFTRYLEEANLFFNAQNNIQ